MNSDIVVERERIIWLVHIKMGQTQLQAPQTSYHTGSYKSLHISKLALGTHSPNPRLPRQLSISNRQNSDTSHCSSKRHLAPGDVGEVVGKGSIFSTEEQSPE